jgi:hypothetical protein
LVVVSQSLEQKSTEFQKLFLHLNILRKTLSEQCLAELDLNRAQQIRSQDIRRDQETMRSLVTKLKDLNQLFMALHSYSSKIQSLTQTLHSAEREISQSLDTLKRFEN